MKLKIICAMILWAVLTTQFISCEDETFESNPALALEFSADTLRFDTIFTELGSATRILKIYNPNTTGVNISSIRLAESDNSSFRLNIDGIPTNQATDLRILPNDSLYVFAEVTIDPDQPLTVSPFIFNENLLIETGIDQQVVVLEAWGQNANYFPNRFSKGTFNLLTCDLDTVRWDDPKPYVIYGVLVVDSCHLVLPAGTNLYVHGGIANQDGNLFNDGLLLMAQNSKLITRGTLDNPVVIQGDRLEPDFEELPGQWNGIRLTAGSRGHSLRHTIVKNAITGIQVDSAASLRLDNVVIRNTAASGLLGYRANITANNTLIHTNGGHSFAGVYGGTYSFSHCTLANFGNRSEAVRLLNYTCDDPLCLGQIFVHPLNANFFNCIIAGSDTEIDMDDATLGADPDVFKYRFVNSIVNAGDLKDITQFQNLIAECDGCIEPALSDPIFVDVDNRDFHLDSLSIAIEAGFPISNITSDLEGNLRDHTNPDAGCYEWQE